MTSVDVGWVGFDEVESFHPVSEGVERSDRSIIIRQVILDFGNIFRKTKAKLFIYS